MKAIADACKVLADPTRLRILRLLLRESLNVSELTEILGVAQPTVSRQLKTLREVGLVEERRVGAWSFFALTLPETGGRAGEVSAGSVAALLRESIAADPDTSGDLSRLQEVLRARQESRSLPLGSGQRQLAPGKSWMAWARGLVQLLPEDLVVADIGCGDGGLTCELARRVQQVIAVEPDKVMREQARERVAAEGFKKRVKIRAGHIERLPMEDATVDACIFSQVLHHTPDPEEAVREAYRVLRRPRGRLLVLDLEPHAEEWVRDKLGDLRLGIARTELARWLTDAGFEQVIHEALPATRKNEKFRVNVTAGTKA